jgi:hypothetical protein
MIISLSEPNMCENTGVREEFRRRGIAKIREWSSLTGVSLLILWYTHASHTNGSLYCIYWHMVQETGFIGILIFCSMSKKIRNHKCVDKETSYPLGCSEWNRNCKKWRSRTETCTSHSKREAPLRDSCSKVLAQKFSMITGNTDWSLNVCIKCSSVYLQMSVCPWMFV